ncbi:hypothetical protein FOZ60_014751 [Perkinsus olseni]|uniref:Uncharacterized protein n=1 Tax=Perkinsus olseni TaxID=32597 RepID=A0A7J6N6Z0_PEROL|nr:hypothetical protein FOZ60_014751 [Perkinsus olseni]
MQLLFFCDSLVESVDNYKMSWDGSGYRQRTLPVLDSAKVITIAEARKRISDRWTVLYAPRNPPSSAVNCIPAVEEGTAAGQESSAAKLNHPHPGGKSMAIALPGSEDARGGGGTTTDGAGDLKPAAPRRSTAGRLERALGQLNSEQLLTLWSELMGPAVGVARGLQWLDQQLTQYYTTDDDDNSIVASSGKKGWC